MVQHSKYVLKEPYCLTFLGSKKKSGKFFYIDIAYT